MRKREGGKRRKEGGRETESEQEIHFSSPVVCILSIPVTNSTDTDNKTGIKLWFDVDNSYQHHTSALLQLTTVYRALSGLFLLTNKIKIGEPHLIYAHIIKNLYMCQYFISQFTQAI